MNFNSNNRKCFVRPPHFKKRMIMMMFGVLILGIGLSLLRMINLGTDPCSCFTQGITNYVPLSFGTCQLLCHVVTFLIVIKYDLSMISFGTIGNMFFVGYISDLFKWIWSVLLPAGFFELAAVRYLLLIPTVLIFFAGGRQHTCVLVLAPRHMMLFHLSYQHMSKRSVLRRCA